MNEPLTINQAVERLSELSGNDVAITGILCFEFEDVSINHFPKAERKDGNQSSIWLGSKIGGPGVNENVFKSLHGKRVIVQGTLIMGDPSFGVGHMGLWPAEILVRVLERA